MTQTPPEPAPPSAPPTEIKKSRWRRFLLGGGLFTPAGLLSRAAVLVIAFAVLHLLGWRDDTSILSGSVAGPGKSTLAHALMGMLYAASYFSAVVLAPILVIASGILRLLMRAFEFEKTGVASNDVR